ncbi:glycosyl transferase family 1 [Staphylococcus nepalensis]|uniref:Glycosyl transferase family 1 n=1 Tax=Staphylococcus nepalensis TaxID=214473 RepID=A0A2T4S9P2_9STAP|nr:glycosyltransferase [Staphylococcus nepalensis]PTK58590.1 glycosyl transferase family 1 [Staphylococcus nepalensis]
MIYTVTSTLPPVHGGRTKALLSRIKLMDTELGITSKIFTTNYNANYLSVYEKFINEGKVTKSTEFENLYDWLSGFNLLTIPKKNFKKNLKNQTMNREIEGLENKSYDDGNVMRYYDDENYVLYRKYYEDSNVIKFEDFMSPISKKRLERWEYNEFGQLHRKIYYTHKPFLKLCEVYFDTKGHIYCKKYFDTDTDTLNYIQIYKDSRPYLAFSDEKALIEFYFEQRFSDNDVVFNDARLLDGPLLNQTNATKNILVFHNSHINGKHIKNAYKFALNHSEKVEKYILLTEKQKEDILNQLSLEQNRLNVIPHSIKSYKSLDKVEKLDRFIFLGRLGAQKQIDHLIKAYKQFLDYGYETKLAIFGPDEAGQKKKMLDLIEQFGIQDKVDINEYTNNPLIEFQKSKASLLTSKFEGFGLTVMESIEVGCPVISYDVRYGPSEIIDHNKNGFLVEPNNIKAFADYMAKIIDNPLTHVHTRPELGHDRAIQNYTKLFQDIGYTK